MTALILALIFHRFYSPFYLVFSPSFIWQQYSPYPYLPSSFFSLPFYIQYCYINVEQASLRAAVAEQLDILFYTVKPVCLFTSRLCLISSFQNRNVMGVERERMNEWWCPACRGHKMLLYVKKKQREVDKARVIDCSSDNLPPLPTFATAREQRMTAT